MDDLGACGVHPGAAAALVCARCGAFACDACAPIPTLLCAACQTRRPTRSARWDEIPPPPGFLIRWGTSSPVLYAVFGFLVLGARFAESTPMLLLVVFVALIAMAAGLFRIVQSLGAGAGRRALRRGLSLMREQRNREAAVLFEETLRFERLRGPSRALALWLFGACASSVGRYERALFVLTPLTASRWRDYRAMRLLRGPGQIVLAVTRALSLDLAGAREARRAYRPTWVHRLTYSPAYGDALLSLREGDTGAHVRALLDEASRKSQRLRDEPLRRATSLLDGFYRFRRGEDPASVHAALGPARLSPAEVPEGLASGWPELQAFIATHLGPSGPAEQH